jgi:hypothetical protein
MAQYFLDYCLTYVMFVLSDTPPMVPGPSGKASTRVIFCNIWISISTHVNKCQILCLCYQHRNSELGDVRTKRYIPTYIFRCFFLSTVNAFANQMTFCFEVIHLFVIVVNCSYVCRTFLLVYMNTQNSKQLNRVTRLDKFSTYWRFFRLDIQAWKFLAT